MSSYIDQMYGYYQDDLAISHHGVKGMHWGVRRYQDPDGTSKKKAAIGSVARVRQKQKVLKSKINSDGILGKGDTNFIRRTMVNDWRRGRIAQLEGKAQNREAIRAFNKDKTLENAKKVGTTALTRLALNSFVPSATGSYVRYRNQGMSPTHSALLTIGRYTTPGFNLGSTVGEALIDVDSNHSSNQLARKNRENYAKRTGQASRL